jgi:predicted RNA-binding protein Jag
MAQLSMYSELIERNRSISGNSLAVERCLAKAKVAGSNPVSRSKKSLFFFFIYSHRIIFMKSIIEQASSIMKAIEKAWNQAEKPKEFSIKIFEQEERNFFGMSTKPAKVGIFFGGDKTVAHEKPTFKPRQEIRECRSSFAKASESRSPLSKVSPNIEEKNKAQAQKQPTPVKPRVEKHVQTTHVDEKPKAIKATEIRRVSATWNDTMITTAHAWIKQTLSLMGLPVINFNSEVAGKNLKLTFNAPLIADPMQEKQLFRSFAHLIMSSLRNQYKQEIKNLKVVLIRPE